MWGSFGSVKDDAGDRVEHDDEDGDDGRLDPGVLGEVGGAGYTHVLDRRRLLERRAFLQKLLTLEFGYAPVCLDDVALDPRKIVFLDPAYVGPDLGDLNE